MLLCWGNTLGSAAAAQHCLSGPKLQKIARESNAQAGRQSQQVQILAGGDKVTQPRRGEDERRRSEVRFVLWRVNNIQKSLVSVCVCEWLPCLICRWLVGIVSERLGTGMKRRHSQSLFAPLVVIDAEIVYTHTTDLSHCVRVYFLLRVHLFIPALIVP